MDAKNGEEKPEKVIAYVERKKLFDQ